MRSDKPVICPDCGDTHYRTASCSPNPKPKLYGAELADFARRGMAAQAAVEKLTKPNPTPNLTAEERYSRLSCLMNSVPRLSDGQHVSATAGDIRAYAARICAKAFEEAAEGAPSLPTRQGKSYSCGWYDAVAEYRAAILAIAKEKAE